MSRAQVSVTGFPGLNLVDEPTGEADGGALSAFNVTLLGNRRIRRRERLTQVADPAAGVILDVVPYYGPGGPTWLTLTVDATTGHRVLKSAAGADLTSDASAQFDLARVTAFAHYGTPNNQRIFIFLDPRQDGGAAGVMTQQFNVVTGAIETPTFEKITAATGAVTAGHPAPKAGHGCVWGRENRLVLTRFIGAADGPAGLPSSPDHVWLLEPGETGKVRDDAFVRLTPGDGDPIQGACAWRDLVFVFKSRKFFVFTHTTTDADDVVEFQWETVDLGVGPVGPHAFVAHTDGVYFVGRDGLYRTDGQGVELLSRNVGPLWTNRAPAYYRGTTFNRSGFAEPAASDAVPRPRLTISNNRLYVAFVPEGTDDAAYSSLLVYDLVDRWFATWMWVGVKLAGLVAGDLVADWYGADERHGVVYASIEGNSGLWFFGLPELDEDPWTGFVPVFGEAAPEGYYHLPFRNLDSNEPKRIAGVEVTGQGEVSLALYGDHAVGGGPGETVDLGPVDGRDTTKGVRLGVYGTTIGAALSGEGEFEVSALVFHLAGAKVAGRNP